MTTLKSFYTRATPNLKKRARYEHFWPSYGVFFWAPRFEVYFSVSSSERPYARSYPHSVSHEQGRAKLPDHLFPDAVFTMKTSFYSNHCKLCIKYKSLTAIPDFKNGDILFIHGAMACYKKKVTWLLMLVDGRFFFKFRYKSLFFSGLYSTLIGFKCCL